MLQHCIEGGRKHCECGDHGCQTEEVHMSGGVQLGHNVGLKHNYVYILSTYIYLVCFSAVSSETEWMEFSIGCTEFSLHVGYSIVYVELSS